jgi:hypothetical protein
MGVRNQSFGVHLGYSNFAHRGDYRRRDPRSMVPVRLAGAEVTEAFWAKLAGLSCPDPKRRLDTVGPAHVNANGAAGSRI